jgi:Golgi phosphoprotein 3
MKKHEALHLHEEILLLALNDEKGTVHFGASFDQAAGGAILAELLLTGRLAVEGEKGKARVVVKNTVPLEEPLLDECLARVAADEKKRKPVQWVQKFAGIKHLKHRVAARLVETGVLKEEKDKVLLLFNRTVYPEADAGPEREVIQRIRHAIVGSSTQVEARTVVLIALAKHTDLLRRAVEKSKLKERKKRVEKLVNGEIAGAATKDAVAAMQAAVMVAVFVPVIATTAVN